MWTVFIKDDLVYSVGVRTNIHKTIVKLQKQTKTGGWVCFPKKAKHIQNLCFAEFLFIAFLFLFLFIASYHTLEAGLSVNHSLGHPITLLIILFKSYLACHVSPPC